MKGLSLVKLIFIREHMFFFPWTKIWTFRSVPKILINSSFWFYLPFERFTVCILVAGIPTGLPCLTVSDIHENLQNWRFSFLTFGRRDSWGNSTIFFSRNMMFFLSPDNIDQETYSHIHNAFALKQCFINKIERFRSWIKLGGSEGGRDRTEIFL